jgi:hypothetical protein
MYHLELTLKSYDVKSYVWTFIYLYRKPEIFYQLEARKIDLSYLLCDWLLLQLLEYPESDTLVSCVADSSVHSLKQQR